MTTFRTRITDLLDRHNILYRVLPLSEPVYTVETAAQKRLMAWKYLQRSTSHPWG